MNFKFIITFLFVISAATRTFSIDGLIIGLVAAVIVIVAIIVCFVMVRLFKRTWRPTRKSQQGNFRILFIVKCFLLT